jgi:hypothetical protein
MCWATSGLSYQAFGHRVERGTVPRLLVLLRSCFCRSSLREDLQLLGFAFCFCQSAFSHSDLSSGSLKEISPITQHPTDQKILFRGGLGIREKDRRGEAAVAIRLGFSTRCCGAPIPPVEPTEPIASMPNPDSASSALPLMCPQQLTGPSIPTSFPRLGRLAVAGVTQRCQQSACGSSRAARY